MSNINSYGAQSGRLIKEDGTYVNRAEGYNDNGEQIIGGHSAMAPVDVQARYSKTVQTHSGTMIGPSAANDSAWINCEGFEKIAISLLNDASTNSQIVLNWSTNGTAKHGDETILSTNSQLRRVAITEVKAPFVIVQLQNGDGAAPHTMNAWAYLKV